MLDIHALMQSLAERRPVFHSEGDFQFELAWLIKKRLTDADVRQEFPFHDKSKKRSLDIWIRSHNIPIELKYHQAGFKANYECERFKSSDSADKVAARYGFVKDISRIERVVKNQRCADRGFAVLLTNIHQLWEDPSKNSRTKKWKCRSDRAFRIHKGQILQGSLEWNPGPKSKSGQNPICLNGRYSMQWRCYSNLKTLDNCNFLKGSSQFRYLALEIEK